MIDPDEPAPSSESNPPNDERREAPAPDAATCDVCGSTELIWQRCKLICAQCHTILMTCGDL
jgi:hypothetical protein